MHKPPTPKALLEIFKKKKIQQVEFWFCDVYGFLKAFYIPIKHLTVDSTTQKNFTAKGFDGSSIAGMASLQDSDVLARADLSSLRYLPWDQHSAAFHCDLYTITGTPYERDIRYTLKNQLQHCAPLQFTTSAKLEFYLIKQARKKKHLVDSDQSGFFDLISIRIGKNLLDAIIIDAATMGIAVEQYHHEVEKSQFAIVLSPQNPLKTADDIVSLRHLIRRNAQQQGLLATFYPKPFANREGSAMKFCLAISQADTQQCALSTESCQTLSELGKSFLVGLCHYGRETMLLSNQWGNSYKRLHHSSRAPSYLECSEHFNETNLQIEVCGQRETPAKKGICITHADAACNPYLALLGFIEAGMAGQSPKNFKLWKQHDQFLQAAKKKDLITMPENLQQAINDFDSGSLMRSILDPTLIEILLKLKREEAEQFEKFVTRWEQKQFIEVL